MLNEAVAIGNAVSAAEVGASIYVGETAGGVKIRLAVSDGVAELHLVRENVVRINNVVDMIRQSGSWLKSDLSIKPSLHCVISCLTAVLFQAG